MSNNDDEDYNASYAMGSVTAIVLIWLVVGFGFIAWLFTTIFVTE